MAKNRIVTLNTNKRKAIYIYTNRRFALQAMSVTSPFENYLSYSLETGLNQPK